MKVPSYSTFARMLCSEQSVIDERAPSQLPLDTNAPFNEQGGLDSSALRQVLDRIKQRMA